MALIKFGAGVVGMSGSIGGTCFARNRYGAYARAKTVPVNPNTSLQQTIRSALSQLTVRWSQTLTAAQRSAWNLYGSNVVMENRLGESVNLSGFNHYIRSNTIALAQALTPVDAGPTIFEVPETDATMVITASEATQVISVAYDDTMDWCNEDDAHMFVFQGAPQNAQRNFFGGPWKYMDKVDGDSVTPPTSPLAGAAVTPIAEGQHLWVYARILRADGRLSPPFRADVLVAA